MLLEYGEVSKLEGHHWYMMELRSEKTIESTMRRVGKSIPSIFRNDPVEVFVPVFKRDLDVFEMKTGPYVFVRSTSFQNLIRLKTITGVVGLMTVGGSNRPSQAITVEDSYVQTVIADAEQQFRNRTIGIEVDSFVRVLSGDIRDYCGVVEAIGDGRAVVRINLKTKSILLETPLRNLLNLSHVPANQRVYYHCPLVEALVNEQGQEGLDMIQEDLKLEEAPALAPLPDKPKRHSRQKTVTALVKRLILVENLHEPMGICRKIVAALKNDGLKMPKNYFIIYGIVKDHLMREYFRNIDPSVFTYHDVIHKYGKVYKFSAQQIAEIDPTLDIPVDSDRTVEPDTDTKKRRGRPRKYPVVVVVPTGAKKRTISEENKRKMHDALRQWHASRKRASE